MPQLFSGPVLAALAFVLWGITPLFYRLIPGADAIELLAQRLVWSLPLLLLARLLIKNRTSFREVWQDKKSLFGCLLGGIVMCVSWTAFTYAITHDQVLAASLGYFINPLCSIALGVIFLSDKLSRFQQLAVILAIVGVGYQVWHYGELPWLAILMGVAFAVYGLIRKQVRYDSLTALSVETLFLFPFALACALWLLFSGNSVLLDADNITRAGYILSAPVTLVPLLLFALAVKRTSLTVVGLVQYIEPSLQFILAVLIFDEPFDMVKGVSFSFIWAGLIFCVAEMIFSHWKYKGVLREKHQPRG
ncbi:EamA family transporter RarD [Plesiomonas shigelloides]|uniref:EamA family transporter RarD n=1 Tax=Plesiomonas shigelloides TaxID=703 RepID=UPI002247C654|nr:EamA family transporter RarD [Plesiomonas shigelloides]MCX2498259.1 EamA family transporter RarD [Plesiomonas shigelloides]